MKQRATNYLLDLADKAEKAGHRMATRKVPSRNRRTPDLMLTQAFCSCGWEGRTFSTKRQALASAMTHLGDLSAAGFPDTPGSAEGPTSVVANL